MTKKDDSARAPSLEERVRKLEEEFADMKRTARRADMNNDLSLNYIRQIARKLMANDEIAHIEEQHARKVQNLDDP